MILIIFVWNYVAKLLQIRLGIYCFFKGTTSMGKSFGVAVWECAEEQVGTEGL